MTKNRIRMQRSAVTLVLVTIIVAATTSACYTVQVVDPLYGENPDLTQGSVQLALETGVTTKHEVLEAFGAPVVTTRDGSGREVWSYQRRASVTQQSVQKYHMITLIIYFDENDVVVDYKSREAKS